MAHQLAAYLHDNTWWTWFVFRIRPLSVVTQPSTESWPAGLKPETTGHESWPAGLNRNDRPWVMTRGANQKRPAMSHDPRGQPETKKQPQDLNINIPRIWLSHGYHYPMKNIIIWIILLSKKYNYPANIIIPRISLSNEYHYPMNIIIPRISLSREYHYPTKIIMWLIREEGGGCPLIGVSLEDRFYCNDRYKTWPCFIVNHNKARYTEPPPTRPQGHKPNHPEIIKS